MAGLDMTTLKPGFYWVLMAEADCEPLLGPLPAELDDQGNWWATIASSRQAVVKVIAEIVPPVEFA